MTPKNTNTSDTKVKKNTKDVKKDQHTSKDSKHTNTNIKLNGNKEEMELQIENDKKNLNNKEEIKYKNEDNTNEYNKPEKNKSKDNICEINKSENNICENNKIKGNICENSTDNSNTKTANTCNSKNDIKKEEKQNRRAEVLKSLLGKLQLPDNKLKSKLYDKLKTELKRTSDVARLEGANWTNLNLSQPLIRLLEENDFIYPSPVQVNTIPTVLNGNDALVRAKNGTGKTLSYVIPIVEMLARIKERNEETKNYNIKNLKNGKDIKNYADSKKCFEESKNFALVIVPTRELAMQVGKVFRRIGLYCRETIMSTFGGSNYHEDILRIEKGAGIIVGTPGRLYDLIEKNVIKIKKFRIIVIDEADKILARDDTEGIDHIITKFNSNRKINKDNYNSEQKSHLNNQESKNDYEKELKNETNNRDQDFNNDYEKLYKNKQDFNKDTDSASNEATVNNDAESANSNQDFNRNQELLVKKQILLISATFPVEIHKFVKLHMDNVKEINLMPELHLKGLKLFYVKVAEERKLHCLKTILQTLNYQKMIIFCNSVISTEKLGSRVLEMNFPCYYFHSKMSYDDRRSIFHKFTTQKSEISVLVATDLITRGIDVPEVNVVINFNLPRTIESFIHRNGRAGRFGTLGCVINFCNENEIEELGWIEKQMGVGIKSIGDNEYKQFLKTND